MKKHFRWEIRYISGKRRNYSPIPKLDALHKAGHAYDARTLGRISLQLAAAALPTSILLSSIKAPTKHLFEYPLLALATQQMLMVSRANPYPLYLDFLCCSFPEWGNKMPWLKLSLAMEDVVVWIPSSSMTAGGTGELCNGEAQGHTHRCVSALPEPLKALCVWKSSVRRVTPGTTSGVWLFRWAMSYF